MALMQGGYVQELFDRVLTINLVCSTVVFYTAARLYVLPKLDRWQPRSVLLPILLLHSLRHLGLMFLTRGRSIPESPRGSPIRRRRAICSRRCSRFSRFWPWPGVAKGRGRWCGYSTS